MIEEVTIRRFKRFREETFDLRGHVILAGPNNCGKTTVLQALAAWGLGLKHWKRLNDFHRHGGAYPKAPISRLAFSAVPLRAFDLLWRDRSYHGTIEITAKLSSGTSVTMEFIADSTEQVYVRPKADVEPAKLREVAVELVYVATASGLSVEEPVYQLDYIETLMGRQKSGEVIRNLLYQASQGSTWDKLTGAVKRLFGVELQVPSIDGGTIVCEYAEARTTSMGLELEARFDILSAGSGFQQVLLLLACLFTRKGAVVLVDEPDAHLHIFLQDTIFSELRRAAAETKSQMVIATHSEVIFNSASPEQICVMMGKPRRLATGDELKRLKQAMAVLQQSDLVAALSTPGIMYLEGYTDLNLLREWADVLDHPLASYLNRTPFWRGKQPPGRPDAAETPVNDHFQALRLVDGKITGVWLIDPDGPKQAQASDKPEQGKLNRLRWTRYETESYLLHPASLARFIDKQTGSGGAEAVRRALTKLFNDEFGEKVGETLADDFVAKPLTPDKAIARYLQETKARTTLVGSILQEGGIHQLDYTEFDQIAAQMLPEEIHPEVKEKLDFIQQAFGL